MTKIHPKKISAIFKLTAITLFCLFLSISNSLAKIGDYKIICGKTAKGQAVECDTSTHQCIQCEEHTHPRLLRWAGDRETHPFYCRNKGIRIPDNCSRSNKGGLEGEAHTQALLWEIAKDEGVECITNNFLSMYTSTCYSCEIVETLASAFVRAAGKAYDVSRQAGNAILVVGLLIWVAVFVLKNITSFSTVEPRQMIQALMIQFFKVFIAFAILNSGIQTILHYTLEPIMLAATDFGDAIMIETTPNGEM